MLSSVASYLFGSTQPEEHESEVELSTKQADGQDDWLIVDLPGGTQSSEVEMTPLENLLIEHPSMSVYNSQGLSGSAGEESDLSESSNDGISKMIARRGLRPRNNKDLVMRHPPRRPQAIAARCGILAQVDSVRNSQRTKRQQDTKRITRGSLEKINKTMHKNTKKFTHKNRLQVPSTRTNFKQVQH